MLLQKHRHIHRDIVNPLFPFEVFGVDDILILHAVGELLAEGFPPVRNFDTAS